MQGCCLPEYGAAVAMPQDLPTLQCSLLAGCSSLVHIDGELVGNATEKAALQAMQWTIGQGGKVAMPMKGRKGSVEILRRFHFSSALKRMSSVVKTEDGYMVFSKGAPEVMLPRTCDTKAYI